VRHLRHLPNRAVELVVGVFDGAERLHWRIVRARAGAFAPIAAAFARRYRAVRDGLAPPDADRIRIGVVPRVVAGAVGLVAIVAVSTALAPSSSSQAVPRPSVGVAAQKASKSTAQRRVASSRVANPKPVRVRAVARREDRVTTAAPPRLVAQRVVKAAGGVQGAQRPKGRAPVTTPPPPAPQPVAPAPQPPPAGETNDRPPGDDENSGPGGGNEDEENGGGKDETDKDKDKDEGEDKDKDKDEDEDEDDGDEPQPQPPPPPDDKDDN
jgi:hypothetical protein